MSQLCWRDRIKVDSAIHHGEPCITGTRVSVSVIVNSIADGDTFDEIIKSYPQLSAEDIHAALRFAAESVRTFDCLPLSAHG